MGGMAHEPDMTAADSAPSEELMDVTQRFWIGSALAVPDFVLEMAAHVADGYHQRQAHCFTAGLPCRVRLLVPS
jgi:hypothetical protein|tara:strand:+ start:785 stop:1006 length:222 start_codon:yes stop_codon:yes gene_type:complete